MTAATHQDRYGLRLSTDSSDAAEAYRDGIDRLLSAWPGAAEAFERALAQVSRRVAVLARESAAALRAERLAAAKAGRQRDWPGSGEMVPRQRRQGPDAAPEPTGERALRNPASEKERAGTLAQGARRQARRDSKRAGAR